MSQPVVAWMDVLDHIEESLAQSLRLTGEPAPIPRRDEGQPGPLAALDERLARWQACLDEAGAQAAAIEDQLTAEEAALEECRQCLEETRTLLADWMARHVG